MIQNTYANAIEFGLLNLTFSSHYVDESVSNPQYSIRLNSKFATNCAWSPASQTTNEYIQLGSTNLTTFVGFAMQGRGDADQYCKKVLIIYSVDGHSYLKSAPYETCKNNTDIVYVYFDTPIVARAIRIVPLEFNGFPSIRCEVYIKLD